MPETHCTWPGHPPIPLDAITEIDKSKWKKKGIAYLGYEVMDPAINGVRKSTAVLDDFVYQQEPTDRIFEAIEKRLAPAEESPVSEEAAESDEAEELKTDSTDAQ